MEDAGRGGQRARAPGFCRVAMPSGDALPCISWCELKAPWVVRAQAHYPQSVMSVFRTPSATGRFWLVLLLVCHAPSHVHSETLEQNSEYQTCLANRATCNSLCAALPPAPGRFLANSAEEENIGALVGDASAYPPGVDFGWGCGGDGRMLHSSSLTGTIPTEIGLLTELMTL